MNHHQRGTTRSTCELCGQLADYCDSIPDASVPGYTPSEAGYRLQPLCWLHAVDRRRVNTSRVEALLVIDGVGHLDRGRASGECVCIDCGRLYRQHPRQPGAECLTVLCDGSLVKL